MDSTFYRYGGAVAVSTVASFMIRMPWALIVPGLIGLMTGGHVALDKATHMWQTNSSGGEAEQLEKINERLKIVDEQLTKFAHFEGINRELVVDHLAELSKAVVKQMLHRDAVGDIIQLMKRLIVDGSWVADAVAGAMLALGIFVQATSFTGPWGIFAGRAAAASGSRTGWAARSVLFKLGLTAGVAGGIYMALTSHAQSEATKLQTMKAQPATLTSALTYDQKSGQFVEKPLENGAATGQLPGGAQMPSTPFSI